jgi:hypothetical protein
MDIDSLVHTIMHMGRVSCPLGKWWVALTTNINTLIPDFNNPVMDSDEEVLNTSQNILDNEELQFY